MICRECPRNCGVERGKGVCKMAEEPRIARAALHFWEEPCISGEAGSGTVFFSGCSLNCVFCQNHEISHEGFGKQITTARLKEIFAELIAKGANNINLVNSTHYAHCLPEVLAESLPVPVVYNSGGYDSVDTLKTLEGKIQIYLPDMKYSNSSAAMKYSRAGDYPETARKAILEMFRQTGPYILDDNGILQSGTVIRHLILPGNLENTYGVIDWVAETFAPGDILFSLMSQYTPIDGLEEKFPELNRRISEEEYSAAMEYLESSGIEDGFFQELSSAKEEYIPPFNLEGV